MSQDKIDTMVSQFDSNGEGAITKAEFLLVGKAMRDSFHVAI
jgi:hypothetical protein